eukprot:TRINITY_DN1272_c0_g2_i2.p1 TRINITY_DN1272_c0_g2~~TRINITY_DN1272_c0_g2_i2.p1  ORF type:complete len:408 (-),score=110.00 TRINITY_DN1272_c0_g2_i2:165-1268(-)
MAEYRMAPSASPAVAHRVLTQPAQLAGTPRSIPVLSVPYTPNTATASVRSLSPHGGALGQPRYQAAPVSAWTATSPKSPLGPSVGVVQAVAVTSARSPQLGVRPLQDRKASNPAVVVASAIQVATETSAAEDRKKGEALAQQLALAERELEALKAELSQTNALLNEERFRCNHAQCCAERSSVDLSILREKLEASREQLSLEKRYSQQLQEALTAAQQQYAETEERFAAKDEELSRKMAEREAQLDAQSKELAVQRAEIAKHRDQLKLEMRASTSREQELDEQQNSARTRLFEASHAQKTLAEREKGLLAQEQRLQAMIVEMAEREAQLVEREAVVAAAAAAGAVPSPVKVQSPATTASCDESMQSW